MSDRSTQTGQLLENEAVQEFIKLLAQNSPGQGQDYSMMLWQMDSMKRQLDAALNELHEVRSQLAQMSENPVKGTVSRITGAVEGRLRTMQGHLSDLKARIIEGAREAVEGFKHMGIKALDRAVSALGIKEKLENTQKDLGDSMEDIKNAIEKVENIGHELRSVGGHIKNAGRAFKGKERQEVNRGSEGRFQSAVLAPLRKERDILSRLNNITLAAIGNLERLEQAAGRGMEESTQAQDGADSFEKQENETPNPGRDSMRAETIKNVPDISDAVSSNDKTDIGNVVNPADVNSVNNTAHSRDRKDTEKAANADKPAMYDLDGLESPEKKAQKGKDKPSVLKDLQKQKAQAAVRPMPVQDKKHKMQEAAI